MVFILLLKFEFSIGITKALTAFCEELGYTDGANLPPVILCGNTYIHTYIHTYVQIWLQAVLNIFKSKLLLCTVGDFNTLPVMKMDNKGSHTAAVFDFLQEGYTYIHT